MRDTGTLTLLEHGAYRTLLDHYYCEEILPNDLARLHHLCRAVTDDEKKAVEYVVGKYFIVENDCLKNSRADREIELRREFLEKQSIKGKRSGEVRAASRGSTAVQPGVNLSSPSPSPLPSLSLSPEPKDQNPSAAEDAATKIVSYYEKEIRDERSSRYRARKNVQALLKNGCTKEVLWECVNLYASDADHKDPQFRKVAGNFFGRDAVYRNYIDEAKRIVEVEYAAKG
jgi:uncharacterized protein YdaU (DUF1376 family)